MVQKKTKPVKPEVPEELPEDLQAVVDAKDLTPQERAKMTRIAYGKRDWPNAEHPGTVRDFMKKHKIPCIYER